MFEGLALAAQFLVGERVNLASLVSGGVVVVVIGF